jgi:hypothetical protein
MSVKSILRSSKRSAMPVPDLIHIMLESELCLDTADSLRARYDTNANHANAQFSQSLHSMLSYTGIHCLYLLLPLLVTLTIVKMARLQLLCEEAPEWGTLRTMGTVGRTTDVFRVDPTASFVAVHTSILSAACFRFSALCCPLIVRCLKHGHHNEHGCSAHLDACATTYIHARPCTNLHQYRYRRS